MRPYKVLCMDLYQSGGNTRIVLLYKMLFYTIIYNLMETIVTNEFSVVLVPQSDFTRVIEQARRLLPRAQRVDPPHMTLLRGIYTPKDMSDRELINCLINTLGPIDGQLLKARVQAIGQDYNERYQTSSVIKLEASPSVINLRNNLIDKLSSSNFEIEPTELTSFEPHLTLALGIPLPSMDINKKIESIVVQGRQLNFIDWSVLRIIHSPKGQRQAYIIHPSILQLKNSAKLKETTYV